jgi:tRNA pseudouridine38-40 synthase
MARVSLEMQMKTYQRRFATMRYFMDITYNGSGFHGWQIQDNAHSVQAEIQIAMAKIFGEDVDLVASGRTDTGVHATQQVAHFDSDQIDPSQLAYKLNAMLPNSIAINSIKAVQDSAHARFDATLRSYQYHIHQKKSPFLTDRSYYFKPELNTAHIKACCELLLDWHDFKCFSKVKTDVTTFNCTISKANWLSTEKGYLFEISANRFLRGMVRAIVGTLIEVGLSKLSCSDFALILERGDRRAAGSSVPAHGLFLHEVVYPLDIYKK